MHPRDTVSWGYCPENKVLSVRANHQRTRQGLASSSRTSGTERTACLCDSEAGETERGGLSQEGKEQTQEVNARECPLCASDLARNV